MIRTRLWIVKGKVWKKDDGNRWAKFDVREVVIAVDSFAGAYDLATEALLHNYSAHPHEAEPISIQPFVRVQDREQVEIVYPEYE
jgi:hypothetical protein